MGTHCLLSGSMHSFPGGSLLACSTQDTQDRCPEQLHLPWHRSSASSPLAKALNSLHLIQEGIARLWALDAVHGLILSFSVDWAIWDRVTISSPWSFYFISSPCDSLLLCLKVVPILLQLSQPREGQPSSSIVPPPQIIPPTGHKAGGLSEGPTWFSLAPQHTAHVFLFLGFFFACLISAPYSSWALWTSLLHQGAYVKICSVY